MHFSAGSRRNQYPLRRQARLPRNVKASAMNSLARMPYALILIAACVASLTVPATACDRNRLVVLQPACGESSDTSGIVDACLALAAADHEMRGY